MRIAHLTPGTGHFYCGSCLRDNTLVRALRRRGHDVTMMPLYLPFALEEGKHPPSERVFMGGILIALPAIMIITLINIAFGIMTRAAPQLNIFAVGFPTTMAAGFLVIFLTLPNLLPRFLQLIQQAFDTMGQIIEVS